MTNQNFDLLKALFVLMGSLTKAIVPKKLQNTFLKFKSWLCNIVQLSTSMR